ncbi:MAG: Iron-sulfur cluster assembly scaffold protein IscU [candidate division WS2 bacterium]|uniref:Iron-sulfur cluster assembly scaffold protein IscU n=1 Tax=Psychracetigena formicireducens TaxID=2986056 RepID=A0A9E2BH20_PSYF1|nr:Iron-sulfur cluster assembly scaffold protein IscU [Candidatus Psychracetigena formicireducens]MBT9144904.1 Iron-sulfur cluster assembly scaffold protein IscU [Candidatus Psychracetigena formicireducens]MBT9147545.1 Iron-sulfur cluster assembly scaffold protein IscU [Bacillota bacterium]
MPPYSQKVMEHFLNPKNVGVMENPDGIGEVGNPVCGDMMTFYISVKNNHLKDIKFQTFGCGAAIAVSSMVSEMAKGKTLEEALTITNKQVAEELGGLPQNKMHCSNLGAEALHKAIEDYKRKKLNESAPSTKTKIEEKEVEKEDECSCPYCDMALTEPIPYCKSCGASVSVCPECGEVTRFESDSCLKCGAKITKK